MSAGGVLASPRAKLRLIVLLGLLATIWWPWCMSQLTYAIYVTLASPSRPSVGLLWRRCTRRPWCWDLSQVWAASTLCKESPLKGWVIFSVSLLVGAAFQSVLTGAAMSDCVLAYFGSMGKSVFLDRIHGVSGGGPAAPTRIELVARSLSGRGTAANETQRPSWRMCSICLAWVCLPSAVRWREFIAVLICSASPSSPQSRAWAAVRCAM